MIQMIYNILLDIYEELWYLVNVKIKKEGFPEPYPGFFIYSQ